MVRVRAKQVKELFECERRQGNATITVMQCRGKARGGRGRIGDGAVLLAALHTFRSERESKAESGRVHRGRKPRSAQ